MADPPEDADSVTIFLLPAAKGSAFFGAASDELAALPLSIPLTGHFPDFPVIGHFSV